MKQLLTFLAVMLLFSTNKAYSNEPDSAFLKVENRNGLYFSWSIDKNNWYSIDYRFLSSDYGPWGEQKKMFEPVLTYESGLWKCIFRVDKDIYAKTSSPDLIDWKPQDYYIDKSGGKSSGDIHKVPWQTIDNLIKHSKLEAYNALLYSEQAKDDARRFAGLKPLEAKIEIDAAKSKKISDKLIGVFFEDISFAADGGLYAELIQNRDFEDSKPVPNSDVSDYATGWTVANQEAHRLIDTLNPVHPNNKHYLSISASDAISLINSGFDGIPLKAGDKYLFSVFARSPQSSKGNIIVELLDSEGNAAASATIKINSKNWKKYETVLISNRTLSIAVLSLKIQANGNFDIDMVSLFPQKTFKNRKNGLRADLAQTIADLKPRFVRFPGGCVAHGQGLDNIYRWKNTIGALEERKPDFNIWGYHQTFGLGYYEYFQFCEDIGAEPLPVLAAGVPCQNSKHNHKTGLAGQQGGIPMDEMDEYVQDILDLIEWANGDAKTTEWGKIRASSGHPKSFNLKYIGIGNEDLISEVFKERFEMIYNAIREKHPEITVIGTVGPFYKGSSDYSEGWKFASKLGVPMVDEHYYESPGWFIHNQDYYDSYDRSKPKVYLGEYAAHLPGRPNNVETALAEALYLTAVERNADVVEMTSYAPLLAKEGHTNWNPDLIYFNNTEIKPTVGYYVQQMFGQNSGDEYFYSKINISDKREDIKKRFGFSVVKDSKTGDYIVKAVNLLPETTKTEIDMSRLQNRGKKGIKTVLTGTIDDKTAKPVSSEIEIGSEFSLELPPYSFTVIRIIAN